MTDLPHDPLDELASAHLDGQTSPEEARRVADDPALQARVEELRALRDAIRSADGPVDALRRDAAIAAALDAMGSEPVAAPASLDAARRNRSTRLRLAIAGAAAAAIAAAIVVPQLGHDDHRTDTFAAGSADPKAVDRETTDAFGDASGGAGTTSLTEGALDSGADAPAASSEVSGAVNLGGAPDVEALGRAVRAAFDTGQQAPPSVDLDEGGDTLACLSALESQVVATSTPDRPVAIVQRGVAQVGGRPTVAVVSAAGTDTSYVLHVSTIEGCAPLGEVTLAPFTVEHPAPVPPPGSVEHPVSGDDDPAHPVPPGQENP